MKPADELTTDDQSFCLAAENEVYVVYLKSGQQTTSINLGDSGEEFQIRWFDPRNGGELQNGSLEHVKATGTVALGLAPDMQDMDWVVLLNRN
jgi:hypothetical protein